MERLVSEKVARKPMINLDFGEAGVYRCIEVAGYLVKVCSSVILPLKELVKGFR